MKGNPTGRPKVPEGHRRQQGSYMVVKCEGHPRASSVGVVLEHILVAEKALGRPIPRKAHVHHVDENPLNNASNNLVICENAAYHKLLHRRMRAYKATGDANAHCCSICLGYDRQDELVVPRSRTAVKAKKIIHYHLDCVRKQGAEQRARNKALKIKTLAIHNGV